MAFAAMEIFVSEVAQSQSSGTLATHVGWSASLASPGAAPSPVPGAQSGAAALPGKQMLVRVFAQSDAYVAVGKTSAEAIARAASGPRQPVPAKLFYDFFADAGDYVAWGLA